MEKRGAFVSVLFIFLMTLSSCTQDDLGDARDNLIGAWRCQEESQVFEVQYYDVEISKDLNDDAQIIVFNFFDRKKDVKIKILGNNLTIEEQEIDGWLVKGTGEISSDNNRISWKFTADDGSGPADFNAYFTVKSPVAIIVSTEN
jgi:hypothetical protein